MKHLLVLSSRELAVLQSCVEQTRALYAMADGKKPLTPELDALIRDLESKPQPLDGFLVKGGVDA